MPLESARFYEFGVFRLDPAERKLTRNGIAVPLPSKSMDVLLVLVENAGRVIERAELIKRVWPDAEGADGSLAVTISALRKILGDHPDGGAYVETIPRQGYRFSAAVITPFDQSKRQVPDAGDLIDVVEDKNTVGAVNTLDQPSTGHTDVARDRQETEGSQLSSPARPTGRGLGWISAHRKLLLACAAIVLVTGALGYAVVLWRGTSRAVLVRRLAILPFQNLKPDDQTEFLGSSLADATTTRLRGFNSLIVRPSSYVERYRGKDIDPKVVAKELDVDTLMTGTFLKEGNTLRVTVQLIDMKKGEIISRFPFETKYDRLMTVQDQVAHNIIDKLQLNLSQAEVEELRRLSTDNQVAYEYFLHGIDMYSKDEFLAAVPLLEKAVELDPNFAIAWAHLGRAYTASASFNLRGRALQLKAQAAYEQALALNSDLIEARIFMANLLTDSNRVEQAVPILRKLLQTNPNIAEARWELGYAYRFAGMLNESISECERARQIDPNVKRTSSAPNYYLYTGQYEKFLNSLPKEDVSAFLVFYRGMGNYYLSRFDQAAAEFDHAYEMDPQLYTRIGKALSYAIRNQKGVAVEVLRDVEREIEQKGVGDSEAVYKVGQAYAVLGETGSALRVLRRSIETGFFCYDYFKNDPLLSSLRAEPEFNILLEIARNRHEQFQRAFF